MAALLNAMTVDVEDYFQVSAFDRVVSRSSWDSLESRVCANTDRLLELFDAMGVRSTFFILGWVAERFPRLVLRIHEAGHELASHGYNHCLVYETDPESFRADIQRARAAIEDAAGVRVQGYRAPSFSITRRSMWALDVLISEGYAFDASIYPIRHDRYGIPDWSRGIHRVHRAGGSIVELPGSTVRRFGVNLPIGGGGYFRLLPYSWTRRGIEEMNSAELPAIFYLHPWEIDPDQPRFQVGVMSRMRHYGNLAKTEERLRRLVREFRFSTVSDVLQAGCMTRFQAAS
jgi:polysaccharide deacetylase family protein (PEP-CTERM system associated)